MDKKQIASIKNAAVREGLLKEVSTRVWTAKMALDGASYEGCKYFRKKIELARAAMSEAEALFDEYEAL